MKLLLTSIATLCLLAPPVQLRIGSSDAWGQQISQRDVAAPTGESIERLPLIESPSDDVFYPTHSESFLADSTIGLSTVGPEEDQGLNNAIAPSPAQGSSSGVAAGLSGLGSGGSRSPFNTGTLWIPSQPVAHQSAELELLQQEIGFKFPLRALSSGIVMMNGGVEYSSFDTDALLSTTGRPFPEELWSVRLGTQFIRKLDSGWTGVLGTSIGSNSDQPFGELRDIQFSLMSMLSVPHGERDAWNFFLFYSPTSEIPFPLPGVSYAWNPNDAFRMNIGVPTSLSYHPTERITIDASYMLLRTVHAQVTYEVHERVSIYGSFDWGNESWFLSDRTKDKERLFSYDKRLIVGMRSEIGGHFVVDLSSGYAFDRFYFTGENYDDRDHDRVDVANGAFTALQGGVTW